MALGAPRVLAPHLPSFPRMYAGFGDLDLAQDLLGNIPPQSAPLRVAFIGSGVNQQGVQGCASAIPIDPCRQIADLTTSIPEGTGTFTAFTAVSASLGHTAFLGLGNQGLDIFAADYPKSVATSCDFAAPVDVLEETETAGGSGLSYDPATDRYKYVWKTDKRRTRTCRQLVLGLKDGTFRRANFHFR